LLEAHICNYLLYVCEDAVDTYGLNLIFQKNEKDNNNTDYSFSRKKLTNKLNCHFRCNIHILVRKR